MHVLIVEDSPRLRRSLERALQRSGYAVDSAEDGVAGLRYALHNPYDVIVLDILLPKLDGLEVLRRMRDDGVDTHTLLLTACDSVEDRVRGLRLGADDYLIKPFSIEELLARVEALVRRTYGQKSPTIEIGPISVNTTARVVRCGDEELHLSRREYALLEYLAYRCGQIVSRHQIEDHLYGEHDLPTSNAVDRLVCALRKKLGVQSDATSLLQTRRGLGYVLLDGASVP